MVPEFETVIRIVDLYSAGWLNKLPDEFLRVYLYVAPRVICSRVELTTYTSDFRIQSFEGQPAVVDCYGEVEWWNNEFVGCGLIDPFTKTFKKDFA